MTPKAEMMDKSEAKKGGQQQWSLNLGSGDSYLG